jgi:putative ABC transport system substrate-binding protein
MTLTGGAVLTWSIAALAQSQQIPIIGFLSSRSPGEAAGLVTSFRHGLGETGFVEGQNTIIAFRWAEGHFERLPALATELVELRVAVLLAAGGPPAALAAKSASQTIPIVFSGAGDAVHLGLVASLNRPGGNLTGMDNLPSELVAKSAQLLKELLPSAAELAFLINSSNPGAGVYTKGADASASALGIKVHVLDARTTADLDQAFDSIETLGIRGLVVPADPLFDSQRDRIVALAARHAVAAIYSIREYAVAGGLMSYGASLTDAYRRAAVYVGRILKGAKPSDLPVMRPTKFELTVNLRTAKALGLTVPDKLLALADEVIE